MSIDELAREAAAEAQRRAKQRVDPAAMLEQLHRTRRARSIGSVVTAIAVVAFLLVGGGLLAQRAQTANSLGTPASSATSSPSESCSDDVVTCLGGDRYRVTLDVPVTFALPANFGDDFSVTEGDSLEVYRSDVGSTGVTVFENPVPVRNDLSWSRDASAGATARSEATWLAHRPFLANAHLTRTMVAGRTAWRVTGTLKPRAELNAWKDSHTAAPTFSLGAVTAGYWPGLNAEYTLLDVPNAGVTVIWSWTLGNDLTALNGSRAYVDGLSFGS